jgi:hypothetical protein
MAARTDSLIGDLGVWEGSEAVVVSGGADHEAGQREQQSVHMSLIIVLFSYSRYGILVWK